MKELARLFLRFAAPLLAVGILGALTNLRVASRQQQRVWIADLGLDKAQVARSIEQTGIPTFPVGQQLFDLVAKCHERNVTEPCARDNAFELAGLFLKHAHGQCANRH